MAVLLERRQVRQVYLVTYSQADLSLVPNRQVFADKVIESFRQAGIQVTQWACSMELHQDQGHHFHMVVKLSGLHRWLAVKNFLTTRYGIVCHFSGIHNNYYSAWKYVTKEDTGYTQSEGHPNLVNPIDGRQARGALPSTNDAPDTAVLNQGGPAKKRKKRMSA